jgi:transcriptional regulator CtsR
VKGKREIIEQRLKELTAKRADLDLEQDRVISWARKGSITEEQLERQIKAISAESEQYSAEQNRLLADLRLVGSGDEVYRQAQELIPAMKSRVNEALTEQAKRDVIDSLVQRALLDASGDLTIEFKVLRPEMSFSSPLSY